MRLADYDDELRAAAFAYLAGCMRGGLDLVTAAQLDAFEFRGERIPLRQHMRGIRVVSGLPAALTILTTDRKSVV